MKKLFIFFAFVVVYFPALPQASAITQDQAIKLAEDFIRYNGYTDSLGDKSKLSYELNDWVLQNTSDSTNEISKANPDSLLRQRHNTLQPKAFFISEDEDYWHIGFLSTSVQTEVLNSIQGQSNLSGRSIRVTKDGKEINMMHKEPLFSVWNKLR